jgi:hypothetical protein
MQMADGTVTAVPCYIAPFFCPVVIIIIFNYFRRVRKYFITTRIHFNGPFANFNFPVFCLKLKIN